MPSGSLPYGLQSEDVTYLRGLLERNGGAMSRTQLVRELKSTPQGLTLYQRMKPLTHFFRAYASDFVHVKYKNTWAVAINEMGLDATGGAASEESLEFQSWFNHPALEQSLSRALNESKEPLGRLESQLGPLPPLMQAAQQRLLEGGTQDLSTPYVKFPGSISPDELAAVREKIHQNAMLPEVLRFAEWRKGLPCTDFAKETVQAVREHNVTIVVGDTGCGKTTQVPQQILDDAYDRGEYAAVICTQPRRIAATSVAERVCSERGLRVGEDVVGYQIRFDCKANEKTRLLYCTQGILLRRLLQAPMLTGVTHVVVDEVHEREVYTDFCLTILRRMLLTTRPDLKVVLMSATIDPTIFEQYFLDQTLSLKTLYIPGRVFPVKEHYYEDILLETGYRPESAAMQHFHGGRGRGRGRGGGRQWGSRKFRQQMMQDKQIQIQMQKNDHKVHQLRDRYPQYPDDILQAMLAFDATNAIASGRIDFPLIARILALIETNKFDPVKPDGTVDKGAVLVFLPGWAEIQKAQDTITDNPALSGLQVMPLHSMVPPQQQQEVFRRPTNGRRKVVLATNIAETSITIEDVVYVIDTGVIKCTTYDPATGFSTLGIVEEARANAKQRKGRAGRCREGVYFALYTKDHKDQRMCEELEPEMRRTSMEEIVLQVKMLQLVQPTQPSAAFLNECISPPTEDVLYNAVHHLKSLGALDTSCPETEETLTPLGVLLGTVPLHPQLGLTLTMGLLAGIMPTCTDLAAILGWTTPFTMPPPGREVFADQARWNLAGGVLSDHVAYKRLLESWKEWGSQNVGYFCREFFVSSTNLRGARSLSNQLDDTFRRMAPYLWSTSSNPSQRSFSNRNEQPNQRNIDPRQRDLPMRLPSPNELLLSSVLCKALFVSACRTHVSSKKRYNVVGLYSAQRQKLECHPSSVCGGKRSQEMPHCFVTVGFEVLKSSKAFLRDVTVVSPALYGLTSAGLTKEKPDRIRLDMVGIPVPIRGQPAFFTQQIRRALDRLINYFIMLLISPQLIKGAVHAPIHDDTQMASSAPPVAPTCPLVKVGSLTEADRAQASKTIADAFDAIARHAFMVMHPKGRRPDRDLVDDDVMMMPGKDDRNQRGKRGRRGSREDRRQSRGGDGAGLTDEQKELLDLAHRERRYRHKPHGDLGDFDDEENEDDDDRDLEPIWWKFAARGRARKYGQQSYRGHMRGGRGRGRGRGRGNGGMRLDEYGEGDGGMDDFELQEDFAEDGSPSSSRMYRHRRQRQSLDAPDSSPGPMLVERPSTSDGVSRSRPASGVDEPDEDEEEEDEGEEEEDEEAGDVFW